jgi:hypothetical protein
VKLETSSGELTGKQDSCLSQLVCHTSEYGGCHELYHGTPDVYMVNKVHKCHCMCDTVVSLYIAIETQQRLFC